MAGNSRRRGATRKAGSKKGATTGSGGRGRRALEGKGPTPKAEDRPYHPAAKRRAAAERAAARSGRAPVADGPGAGRAARGGPAKGGRRPGATAAGRKAGSTGHELVTGRNAVLEALRAGVPASALHVASTVEADDRVREALRLVQRAGVPLLEVTRQELDRLTDGAVHQGMVLQVPPYDYAHPTDLLAAAERSGRPALVVALDGVTDPRNLGAALRSAGAFGAHGLVVPSRRSAGVTAAAWKVSAGAAARVPVAQASNLVQALQAYRQAGCFVVGLDAGGGIEVSALEVATEPLVLVVGSEGKGLSRLVRETCDVVAAIPMQAATESLNAGVATGIALYEVARLRRR